MGRNYWMAVEPPEVFEHVKRLGFTIYALGPKYRRRAERMQPNDRILFYVTRLRKWTATCTITSHCFEERTPIWGPDIPGDQYPYRVKLTPNIVLHEQDYIDALVLAPTLEYVKRWLPEDWPLAFLDKLHLLPQKDFRLIEGEMERLITKRGSARDGKPQPQGVPGQANGSASEVVGQPQTAPPN
jgi:hypothetical protein